MQRGDWTSFEGVNSQQLSCQNEDSGGGNPGNEESSYATKCDKVDQFSKGWTSINLWQERNCRDKGFNKAPRLQPLVCSRHPWCMEWADICDFASTNSFQELKQQSSLPIFNREIFFYSFTLTRYGEFQVLCCTRLAMWILDLQVMEKYFLTTIYWCMIYTSIYINIYAYVKGLLMIGEVLPLLVLLKSLFGSLAIWL